MIRRATMAAWEKKNFLRQDVMTTGKKFPNQQTSLGNDNETHPGHMWDLLNVIIRRVRKVVA